MVMFVIPCFYFAYFSKSWSPEFLLSMMVWAIAMESFVRYCYAYTMGLMFAVAGL